MIAPLVCICGDTKLQHKMGKGGCKEVDCGCDRYEPVDAPQSLAAGESTSARLRRVSEQRDGLVDVTEQLSDDVLKLAAALKLAKAELASARTELEQLRAELARRSA